MFVQASKDDAQDEVMQMEFDGYDRKMARVLKSKDLSEAGEERVEGLREEESASKQDDTRARMERKSAWSARQSLHWLAANR